MTITAGNSVVGAGANSFDTSGSPINNTGVSLIVASSGQANGGGNTLGVLSDNTALNIYTPLTQANIPGDHRLRIIYCENPAVSSSQYFIMAGANMFASLAVQGFLGAATSSVFDVENQNTGTTTGLTTGSVTPSQANSLIIAANSTGDIDTPTINGGFGTPLNQVAVSGVAYGCGLSLLIQTSIVAANPTWTFVNSIPVCASIAVFKPAAGGGGNVVSGGPTEGADATGGGSIKVAIKASGGVTEGKDATSGSLKLASKVSGGATEGPDAAAGSVKVALKVSGGVTEGADFTTGAISVGSTHVSGSLTEGADATGGGSIKVALHVSGGLTEGKDATAGNLLVAVKVSGGITEGADFTTGSITATSRTISGGFTEGADRTTGIIISGTVSQGGHFLPLTKKEIAEARKRAKAARDKEEAGWDQAAKDKADLHQQIMKTLHPEKILGTGKIQTPEDDDDEADIEMLLLYG